MLKEIHEQADAVAETIADRTVRDDGVDLDDEGALDDERCSRTERIVIVACGTSYHAGLIGRYAIEEWARVPVEMDIASRVPLPQPDRRRRTISSSASRSPARPPTRSPRCGSRASAARRSSPSRTSWARRRRATPTACSSRAPGSRSSVAATKTFVCQVAVMYLLALRLARAARHARPRAPDANWSASSSGCRSQIRGSARERRAGDQGDRRSPLARASSSSTSAATSACRGRARGRAEAQGDLLHLDRRLRGRRDEARADRAARRVDAGRRASRPTRPVLEKVVSNMQEVRARGAHVIAVATEGNDRHRRARRVA